MSNLFPRTGGRLRRLFDLRQADERTVVGWIEGDFHHFGITLTHEGEIRNGASLLNSGT